MRVRSLGYRTDLIFPAFEDGVQDRGDYLVIRTPSNPTYYWGNFLLFPAPPEPGDVRRWPELFAQEIGAPPGTRHQTFGWDSPEGRAGAVRPFLDAGFRLERSTVLATDTPRPPRRRNASVSVRRLISDADWTQAIENQVVGRDPAFEEGGYRIFRDRQMALYRRMASMGLGQWYGAFADGRLVADLGIFRDGDVGRYQSVLTHPDVRGRGIGGELIFEAGIDALARHRLETLVIVAETDSDPMRLYRSLGWEPVEAQLGLERWLPDRAGEARPTSAGLPAESPAAEPQRSDLPGEGSGSR